MKAQNIVQSGMLDTEVTQKIKKKFIRGVVRQQQRPLLLAGYFVKKYVSKKSFFLFLFFLAIFLFIRKRSPQAATVFIVFCVDILPFCI